MAIDGLSEEADQITQVIERAVAQIQAGAIARLIEWSKLGESWSGFLSNVEAAGYKPAFLLAATAIVYIVTVLTIVTMTSVFAQRLGSGQTKRIVAYLGAAIAAIFCEGLLLRWFTSDPALRSTLMSSIVNSAIATVICAWLVNSQHRDSARPWLKDLAIAIGFASVGLTVQSTFRTWNAAFPLRDFVGTILIALPFSALVIFAYLRHRRAISDILSFGSDASAWRRRISTMWPFVVVLLVVIAVLSAQVALTLGLQVRGGAVLMSLLLVLAGPHIDAAVEMKSRRAIEGEDGELAGALWRTLRILVAATILAALTSVWFLPLLNSAGISSRSVLLKTAEILFVVLVVAFLWNWVSILSQHLRRGASVDSHDANAPASRLGTVGPLLVGLAKGALLVLGSLTALVILGINVWPLITGFSIFGLAIGLGSQTLVKDIVAGLFFLFDDAFRHGEYIETSGAKGTVERISVRSVSLRHPRGAVATIPYGQIGKIQNFSREWVIEKIPFRVALGTDIDLVRKLFKQVGQEIAADPELSADLLEPFKCQGITALDEGTIVVRGKFKAKAGKQFSIRKAVLSKVKRALEDNGIPLVPKPLQVPTLS